MNKYITSIIFIILPGACKLRWGFLSILFLAFQIQGHAQISKGGEVQEWMDLYVPCADDVMPYRLMEPMGFEASNRYPVIVSLHGGGGRGRDNRKQLKIWNEQLADSQRRTDYPCYVLALSLIHI